MEMNRPELDFERMKALRQDGIFGDWRLASDRTPRQSPWRASP
jgi:hypothetical protein